MGWGGGGQKQQCTIWMSVSKYFVSALFLSFLLRTGKDFCLPGDVQLFQGRGRENTTLSREGRGKYNFDRGGDGTK